jgi:peroxiredoxin
MAWTGACTKEMCAVRDDYNAYQGLNANIAGVSVDSHFALNKFAAENNIQYPLLSDYNRETIKAYDIVQSDFAAVYKDVAKRATFVIDKNGIVRYIQILQNIADFPDMDAIRNELKKITDVPVS